MARVDMLAGKKMTFDEESKALYDAVAPHHDEAHFQAILDRARTATLPGERPARRSRRGVPAAVRHPARAARRGVQGRDRRVPRGARSQHIELPPGESFIVEYVTDKSWSGYNWYKGDFHSLIQVNTDLPIFIDRAIDLACHEGYPGHHVYNALLEKNLVRDRGWIEFSVYPLFSPAVADRRGHARTSASRSRSRRGAGGVRARRRSSRSPGSIPRRPAQYYRGPGAAQKLSYAGNEAARRYLDGEIDATQAAELARDATR